MTATKTKPLSKLHKVKTALSGEMQKGQSQCVPSSAQRCPCVTTVPRSESVCVQANLGLSRLLQLIPASPGQYMAQEPCPAYPSLAQQSRCPEAPQKHMVQVTWFKTQYDIIDSSSVKNIYFQTLYLNCVQLAWICIILIFYLNFTEVQLILKGS